MKKVVSLALAMAMGISTFAGAAYAAPAINFDEDPYEVHVQFVGLFEENRDLAAVEEAASAITLDKINCTVKIDPVFIGELPTKVGLGVVGGEKLDVVTVGLTNALSNAASSGQILPLDDLIAERGPAVQEATANVYDAQKINGQVYAVSGYTYPALSAAFVYNKTMADEYGIEMKDYMTYEEFDAVGEILKEHGVYLTSVGSSAELNFKFFNGGEYFGGAGEYGAILDPINSTTIENVYASDAFRDYCYAYKRWADNGYVPSDQLTDTVRTQEHFVAGDIFGTTSNMSPDQKSVWFTEAFEVGFVQLIEPLISTSSVTEFMLGIASNCQRPDKAMDFINLLYEDKDLTNILQYGVEGVTYGRVEGTENVITYEGTPNADRNGYNSTFVRFGNPMNRYVVAPMDDSYYAELEAFNAEAGKSLDFGYSFDASDYMAESGAISNVLAEYLPLLNAGLATDVDEQIANMLKALESAGINDVIAANQAALDEFMK